MEKTKGLFSEVKVEIVKANFIYSFLDSVMLFFILYFAASFFNISFIYTLLLPGVTTIIFFMFNLGSRLKKSRLKDMEDANPQLREILRTAHDNQDDNNFMVKALFDELKGKLRTSSSGKLLDPKRIMMRVASAIAIVFLIVFLSSITINLKKIDIPYEKLKFLRDKTSEARLEGEVSDLLFNQTNAIYGDASIARLGDEAISININPAMSKIDLTRTGEAEERELSSAKIPQEVEATGSAYNSQKLLEEAEAAVNYSQRISKIS
jgi:hypothetical protein